MKTELQKKKKRLNKQHRRIWEKVNGPIPKGMHLHHKDGDYTNGCLDNLIVCTPGEHVEFHRLMGHKISPNFILKGGHLSSIPKSQEHRDKISKTLLGRKNPEHSQKMIGRFVGSKNGMAKRVMNIKTLETFECLLDASKSVNISYGHLKRCIVGLRPNKTDLRYIDDQDRIL